MNFKWFNYQVDCQVCYLILWICSFIVKGIFENLILESTEYTVQNQKYIRPLQGLTQFFFGTVLWFSNLTNIDVCYFRRDPGSVFISTQRPLPFGFGLWSRSFSCLVSDSGLSHVWFRTLIHSLNLFTQVCLQIIGL